MSIIDRRDEMSPPELAEELELRFPEQVSRFETDYPEAWAAILEDDPEACDPEEWDDLLDDLRSLLRV